jgi:hypothetical protein
MCTCPEGPLCYAPRREEHIQFIKHKCLSCGRPILTSYLKPIFKDGYFLPRCFQIGVIINMSGHITGLNHYKTEREAQKELMGFVSVRDSLIKLKWKREKAS